MAFACPSGEPAGRMLPYAYSPNADSGKLRIGDVIVNCPKHPERNLKWDRDLFITLGEVAEGGNDLLRKFGYVP